jgi:glucokinase
VYRAICAVDGHTPVLDTPEAITAAAWPAILWRWKC